MKYLMSENNSHLTFIKILKGTGLTHSEASIYLELLKYGESGTIVLDLIKSLESMKRTTLYSVLSKLEKMGGVVTSENSNTPRNVRIYTAVSPIIFLQNKIDSINKELQRLKELEPLFENQLNKLYLHGASFGLEDVNDLLKPYAKPLLDSGWKIRSTMQEEHVPVLNYSVYEIIFLTEKFYCFEEIPFHLFLFDEVIEENYELFHVILKSMILESQKIISAFLNNDALEIKETQVQLFHHSLSGFYIRVKKSDLEKDFFPSLMQYFNVKTTEDLPEIIDFGLGVAIPIKNKLFYIWAESVELVEKAIEPIFSLEGI